MQVPGAILGWLLTWLIMFGYGALGRVLTARLTGRSGGGLIAAGSIIGFIFGVLAVGRFTPDKTGSWVSSYFDVLVFYFTDFKGILLMVGGAFGWWQSFKS